VHNDAELVAKVSASDGEQIKRYEDVDKRTLVAFSFATNGRLQ
jgi:hypothetical protein